MAPREFNLMFRPQSVLGATSPCFLRPEPPRASSSTSRTSSIRRGSPFHRHRQAARARNEITPRNFTFRSREFEQMEIEFFASPRRARRVQYCATRSVVSRPRLPRERLQLRATNADELSTTRPARPTSSTRFRFCPRRVRRVGGIAIAEISISAVTWKQAQPATRPLEVELGPDGQPKHRGAARI